MPEINYYEFSRHLDHEWMPVPVNTYKENNIIYQQRTFVAPLSTNRSTVLEWIKYEPLLVSEFTIKNTSSFESYADISVTFNLDQNQTVLLKKISDGVVISNNMTVLAYANTSDIKNLKIINDSKKLTIQGYLPADYEETFVVYIPGWELNETEVTEFQNPTKLLADTKKYWEDILSKSFNIEIPSNYLKDLIFSSKVHCMLAARNEEEGRLISPWISSDRYGPLESEAQAVINGMSLMGQEEFARRSLDFFINRYNEDGLLTTGYTLWGIGWHFWTIGDYYKIHRNPRWRRFAFGGRKVPEYLLGLHYF